MSISMSPVEQIEEEFRSADPSLFKRSSPFSLGMEDWFSDLDEDFRGPKPKMQRKSLSLGEKPNRFELVSEREAESSAKGVVPTNTQKNNRWALNTFTLQQLRTKPTNLLRKNLLTLQMIEFTESIVV